MKSWTHYSVVLWTPGCFQPFCSFISKVSHHGPYNSRWSSGLIYAFQGAKQQEEGDTLFL